MVWTRDWGSAAKMSCEVGNLFSDEDHLTLGNVMEMDCEMETLVVGCIQMQVDESYMKHGTTRLLLDSEQTLKDEDLEWAK